MFAASKRKNGGVNGVEPKKNDVKRRISGKVAALTAFNRKNSGVSGVEPQK